MQCKHLGADRPLAATRQVWVYKPPKTCIRRYQAYRRCRRGASLTRHKRRACRATRRTTGCPPGCHPGRPRPPPAHGAGCRASWCVWRTRCNSVILLDPCSCFPPKPAVGSGSKQSGPGCQSAHLLDVGRHDDRSRFAGAHRLAHLAHAAQVPALGGRLCVRGWRQGVLGCLTSHSQARRCRYQGQAGTKPAAAAQQLPTLPALLATARSWKPFSRVSSSATAASSSALSS